MKTNTSASRIDYSPRPVQMDPPRLPDNGIILTDLSLTPIAIDSGAVAILNDVSHCNDASGSEGSIPREIADAFRNRAGNDWSGLQIHFSGARFEYHCTMYQVDPQNGILRQPLVTLYLHRNGSAHDTVLQIATRCGLTPREGEVMTEICAGLTSKEVAQRMRISPNTVKTYVHSIMVKLGVTTRAAIVGTLLRYDDESAATTPDLSCQTTARSRLTSIRGTSD
jgi:DNA-binding CsgD family transcriptional regulator